MSRKAVSMLQDLRSQLCSDERRKRGIVDRKAPNLGA
jgi:hypothetical protein